MEEFEAFFQLSTTRSEPGSSRHDREDAVYVVWQQLLEELEGKPWFVSLGHSGLLVQKDS